MSACVETVERHPVHRFMINNRGPVKLMMSLVNVSLKF